MDKQIYVSYVQEPNDNNIISTRYIQNIFKQQDRNCFVKLLPWHYDMADFVPDTIGRNTYYIRHVSAIGCNTIVIWRIFGWLP